MDLVNEIVRGITGLTLDDWIQEILEAVGLDKVLDELGKLLPNMDCRERHHSSCCGESLRQA